MNLRSGDTLEPRRFGPIEQQALSAMADLLDDHNPIHLEPEAARAAGLGDRTVNQGPANFGYVADLLRERAPGARLAALNVRLMGNVFCGDVVVAGGEVRDVTAAGDTSVAHCSVWLDVADGARVLEGSATLELPTT